MSKATAKKNVVKAIEKLTGEKVKKAPKLEIKWARADELLSALNTAGEVAQDMGLLNFERTCDAMYRRLTVAAERNAAAQVKKAEVIMKRNAKRAEKLAKSIAELKAAGFDVASLLK